MIIRIKDSGVHAQKSVRVFYFITALFLIGLLTAGYFLIRGGKSSSPALAKRPAADQLLFDFARLLRYEEESVQMYLAGLRDRFQIEFVIVTLPSLRGWGTVHDAALKLMTDWKVGERFGNRGILLLLADKEKEVKMEVSYELEDIFTDSFTGSAEDLQLKPHFRQGSPGPGLVAVIEEMEKRSEIKKQHQYTPQRIEELDAQFASGGAGAVRRMQRESDLEKKRKVEALQAVLTSEPCIFLDSALLRWNVENKPGILPGRTPAEAFDNMWAAYREMDDTRPMKYFERIKGRPYEVLQNENRAVIWFGENNAEENTPFLFARVSEGWVFDLVNQSRYVRYGPALRWGLERGDHDYMNLFDRRRYSYWMDCDVPWEEEDFYRPENDKQIVSEIVRLEPQYRNNSNDFETALELGRLSLMIGKWPRQIFPYLETAKKLRPQSARPYKYLGIGYLLNGALKKAIVEMEEMLKRDPESLFGHKFMGYLYYQNKDYDSAVRQLDEALRIDPHDCYALTYLSHAYASRFQAGGSASDKKEAAELMPRSEARCYRTYGRAWWLKNLLWDMGLISKKEQPLVGLSFYSYNYRDGKGVLVYNVMAGQPADLAGVQEGDFIMAFNGQPIYDHFQLFELFRLQKPGQKVELEIIRGALEGPLTLGDVTVNPETYGLSQPQRMTVIMTIGRKE